MPKIIAIANQKGGVGKSTTTIQLGFFLRDAFKLVKKKLIPAGDNNYKNGKNRTLVIDLDPQGNTSSRVSGFGAKFGDYDYGDVTTGADLFSDQLDTIKVFKTPSEEIDLIPTPKNCPVLSEIERKDVNIVVKPMSNLKAIMNDYDYVLIDCPPSLGLKLITALSMATHVVTPIRLSGFAVEGLEGLLKTIQTVKKNFNPDIKNVGVFINNKDGSRNTEKAFNMVKENLPSQVLFEPLIGARAPLDEATDNGVPIWDIKHGHVARKEMLAVLEELMQRVDK